MIGLMYPVFINITVVTGKITRMITILYYVIAAPGGIAFTVPDLTLILYG